MDSSKLKSKSMVFSIGALAGLCVIGLSLSASASLDHGGFYIKATNLEEPSINARHGMDAAPSSPGGGGGTVTPTVPAIGDATPVGPVTPEIITASWPLQAKDGSSLWNRYVVVVESNGNFTYDANLELTGLLDASGVDRGGFIYDYNAKGEPLAYSTWNNGNSAGLWKNPGSGYQFLGEVPVNDGEAFSVSSPSGAAYFTVATLADFKIYRSVGGKFELFRTIANTTGNYATPVAISDSGTVAIRMGEEVLISNAAGNLGTIGDARGVVALPSGGFAVGTSTGITRVTDGGSVIDKTDLGGPVSELTLGANGRIAYLVGLSPRGEYRTLDPSGKQLLWGYVGAPPMG